MDFYSEFLSLYQNLETTQQRQQRLDDEYRQFQEKFNTYKTIIEVELPQLFKDFAFHANVMRNMRRLYVEYAHFYEPGGDRSSTTVQMEQEIRWIILRIRALLKAIPEHLESFERYMRTTDFGQNYQTRFNETVRNDCDFNEILTVLKDLIDLTSTVHEPNPNDGLSSIESADIAEAPSPS